MNGAEWDMKNYADRGGCYPPRLKTEVDNTQIVGKTRKCRARENFLNSADPTISEPGTG